MGPRFRGDDSLRNKYLNQMAGISPGHFHFVNVLSHRGGAVPGGGGGSDAVPPLSNGVMRRMVTRRLMRLGPSGWFFWDFAPEPCRGRVFAGPRECWGLNPAAGLAGPFASHRMST